MDKQTENKIRDLIDQFHLLRTKEDAVKFDNIWKELTASIPLEERSEAGRILREEMKNRRERIRRTDIDVRNQIGDLGDVISLSYIAQHYFQKDRSWLAQRTNGNIDNRKPSAFTDDEL